MKIDKSERICAFCELATPLCNNDTVLCRINGVVTRDHKCKRFVYDPLKRIPPKAQTLPELEYINIDD